MAGNPVQCYPVANYPLGVKVAWEPRQEGSGDPSPDNIRPITGMDEVQVTRRGGNLYNADALVAIKGDADGFGYGVPADDLIIGKTYTISVNSPIFSLKISDYINGYSSISQNNIVDGKYTFVMARNSNISDVAQQYVLVSIYIYMDRNNLVSSPEQAKSLQISICAGDNAIPYETYQPGTTATLSLPETIYGGTVDAVTGVGNKEWAFVEFDGTEKWQTWGVNNVTIGLTGFYYYMEIPVVANSAEYLSCSHLAFNGSSYGGREVGFQVTTTGDIYWMFTVPNQILTNTESSAAAVDSWKSYLAAQSAAGTPLQVVYKLATPEPFQATGGQSILALPGTNTIYTDADGVTVTGRADPIATITALQTRVSALESAALN